MHKNSIITLFKTAFIIVYVKREPWPPNTQIAQGHSSIFETEPFFKVFISGNSFFCQIFSNTLISISTETRTQYISWATNYYITQDDYRAT